MSTLFSQIDRYKELLDRKDELAEQTKENNAAIDQMKKDISQTMIDEECPKISRNGFVYSLQQKTMYSKKSEEDLMEAGIDYLETLREQGLGNIIVEKVDTRTLQSTMAAYVEENGQLSPELADIVNVYDTYDIQKRKETNKAAKKK